MTPRSDWITAYLHAGRKRVLALAAGLTVLIAALDAAFNEVSLGFVYILAIVLASGFLSRWQIAVYSALCVALREAFSNDPMTLNAVGARVVMIFGAYLGSGLFVCEVCRNRRMMVENLRKIEEQTELRRRAEEELRVVVDTSPAAIVIVDDRGSILAANDSARNLLGLEADSTESASIFQFLPALETVPRSSPRTRPLRSNLECRGRRGDGTSFLAQVWLSTYHTPDGPRMAAIVLDASESLRERDGGGLPALMLTSRILVGAVSHSVRNLCAAARVAYANLQRDPEIASKEDFQALGAVVRGLESVSSAELTRASAPALSSVDPNTLLDEFRIVIEPGFDELGIAIVWSVPDGLPPVVGEHHGLLHALLNLAQNSQRALGELPGERRFSVSAAERRGSVQLRLVDNAGGVTDPAVLFQAFHPGASGSGLGLYVARSIVRTFDGDLRYEPTADGSAFIMELIAAHQAEANAHNA